MERPKRTGIALCVPADEKKINYYGKSFIIQPKLNGERGIVTNFEGSPILLSSYQNPISTVDQITTAIAETWEHFQTPYLFDGEIYKHGWSRERIDSALRSNVNLNKEAEELEFHIFDIILPLPQAQRLFILIQLFEEIKSPFLKLVPTYRTTKEDWLSQAETFVENGYEGAVLRNSTFPTYQPRRMVSQMLKYKPTETDEYTITGVTEAISKDGTPLSMIGAFTVCSDDGSEFSVGAGKLSHSQRKHYWMTQQLLTGKTLITKQGKIKTSTGLPTCAVAVEVKD